MCKIFFSALKILMFSLRSDTQHTSVHVPGNSSFLISQCNRSSQIAACWFSVKLFLIRKRQITEATYSHKGEHVGPESTHIPIRVSYLLTGYSHQLLFRYDRVCKLSKSGVDPVHNCIRKKNNTQRRLERLKWQMQSVSWLQAFVPFSSLMKESITCLLLLTRSSASGVNWRREGKKNSTLKISFVSHCLK